MVHSILFVCNLHLMTLHTPLCHLLSYHLPFIPSPNEVDRQNKPKAPPTPHPPSQPNPTSDKCLHRAGPCLIR